MFQSFQRFFESTHTFQIKAFKKAYYLLVERTYVFIRKRIGSLLIEYSFIPYILSLYFYHEMSVMSCIL